MGTLRNALGMEKDEAQWKEFSENRFNKSDLIYFDEQVSMLERTALKYYPIIQEVAKKMTRHKEVATNEYAADDEERRNPYQSAWVM